MTLPANSDLDARILRACRLVAEKRGRALIVGGWVRDRLLGIDSKDVDVEVFGLSLEELRLTLANLGTVIPVGKSFGVLRVEGLNVDFSLPRVDRKTGTGHRGFQADLDPNLDFATAARRRDFTINAMGFDPLTGELLDPHGGRTDLGNHVLRETDAAQFGDDPLRALRAAQFIARFGMAPSDSLTELCARQDLSELSAERIFGEFRKLLLRGTKPSAGLAFLRTTGLVRHFPELAALVGVPQDPRWHPEGDVWIHTLMVVDEAATLRTGDDADLTLMFGALCHDLGKPATTACVGHKITSYAHDEAGVAPTMAFLDRMRAPDDLTAQVAALVRHHLAPAQLLEGGAKDGAYRRLARKLAAAGATPALLARVARADHLGRTTAEALVRSSPATDAFLARIAALTLETPIQDVVLGRHLIERGFKPGKEFGEILAACREVQDETGWTEWTRILDRVLRERDA